MGGQKLVELRFALRRSIFELKYKFDWCIFNETLG